MVASVVGGLEGCGGAGGAHLASGGFLFVAGETGTCMHERILGIGVGVGGESACAGTAHMRRKRETVRTWREMRPVACVTDGASPNQCAMAMRSSVARGYV